MQVAWKITVVIVVVGLLGWGASDVFLRERELRRDEVRLSDRLETLEKENISLSASIEYYQNPENLIKELKSQFNYREEGESLLIVVPRSEEGRKAATSTQ